MCPLSPEGVAEVICSSVSVGPQRQQAAGRHKVAAASPPPSSSSSSSSPSLRTSWDLATGLREDGPAAAVSRSPAQAFQEEEVEVVAPVVVAALDGSIQPGMV